MNKAAELILKSNKIYILGHEDEDPDSVGSCFAMRSVLLKLGKEACCCLSAPLEIHTAFMGDCYTVFDENTDYTSDLCICLDCANISRLGARKKVFDSAKNTISVDHHERNSCFADVNIVDSGASATAEILYGLFVSMGITVDRDIAKDLYAAISADTGSFKYSNVTEKTMRIGAELIKTGIDHAKIARLLHDTDPIEVIRCRAEIMQNIECYFDGRLVIVTADGGVFEKHGITERDSGDIVNIARAVEGCIIAASIRETCGQVKISLRSNDEISVSESARRFDGGGHARAAGAKISGKTIEEVKEDVIKACGEVLNGRIR